MYSAPKWHSPFWHISGLEGEETQNIYLAQRRQGAKRSNVVPALPVKPSKPILDKNAGLVLRAIARPKFALDLLCALASWRETGFGFSI